MASPFKPATVKNLGGLLDIESAPDEIGLANFTLLKNASTRAKGKKCRRGGWKKLFDEVNDEYNNEDLHDQLIGLQIYYEELSARITENAFVEWNYPYWWPAYFVPGSVYRVDNGLVDGPDAYWPDIVAEHGWFRMTSGWSVSADQPYFLGFPYEEVPGTDVENTGPPNYYMYSYFYSQYSWIYDTQVFPGYAYGDPQPIYIGPNTYLYEYCGTYPYVRPGCTEAITFLGDVSGPEGRRVLVAGTKTRLYSLNIATGNWKIVADGLGTPLNEESDCENCSAQKWMSANLDNVMILVNGINPVLAYNPTSEPTGCALWRASYINDLDTLNISSAGTVGSWKGFIFLGDVWQDGARRRNRIIWSDYNDPYAYVPADDSLAGYQDLGTDDTILRIEGISDFVFIYTDRSIYRGTLVVAGDTTIFSFEEIYRGDLALKFKYSLVNMGEAHLYWAEDGIYMMTSFDKRPQQPDWMKIVSVAIYNGITESELTFGPINKGMCEHFVGGYNAQHKELWFSWPTDSHDCPNISIVFNLNGSHLAVDFVDHGFTAFHWFDGMRSKALFEWLEDLEICPRESLLVEMIKEGQPLETTSDPFSDPPTNIDEACLKMATQWIDEICRDCETLSRFVMADASDFCLKEYADTAYYREQLVDSLYVMQGYDTIIQSGWERFNTENDKTVRALIVTYDADVQTTPNFLYAYINSGPQPSCMTWSQIKFYDYAGNLNVGRELACLTEKELAQHQADHTIPDLDAKFPCKIRGKYLGYKLKVFGTGGGSCFSRVELRVDESEQI